MDELNTSRLWEIGAQESPSPYARMIPGASGLPSSGAISSVGSAGNKGVQRAIKPALTRAVIQSCYARAHDRFQFRGARGLLLRLALYAALALLSFIWMPGGWTLRDGSIPLFALLVALIVFREVSYKHGAVTLPSCGTAVPAGAALLAIGLVLIAAWQVTWFQVAEVPFAIGLAALVAVGCFPFAPRKGRDSDDESRKILIVGAGPVARSVARGLRNETLQRSVVCGFVDDDLPLSPAVLGRIDDLEWLARSEFIDEVILALPGHPVQTRKAAETALRNRLDIRAVPDLPPGPWPDSGVEHIGEVPVITLHRELSPKSALLIKRWIDVIGSVGGLVATGPLLAILAFLIRIDSPGPVIYAAERVGAKGRRFRCYKFRSMVTNAEHLKEDLRRRNQREGPIFKIDGDPRITRVGRIIRRYSLDELPQLWNVLRGEMSLVGPRPHPVDEVNHYDLQHPRRLDVKPGITGLWQITARDCPSFELNMHLDLTYIENWSLGLDLRILAGTIRVLFAPEGA